MKEPNGADLLRTLIKLYSEQEGVKISCEIIHRSENDGKLDVSSDRGGDRCNDRVSAC